MEEVYYKPEEIAARFKITRAAVYKWIAEGRLEATRLGKATRISQRALDAFIELSKVEAEEAQQK